MLPDRVLQASQRLSKELEAAVGTIDEPRLRAAALHYPQAGGKALRPALAVTACQAAGGQPEAADPLALSVELLHTFSLVHDDLMDRDEVRRGVPAVHKAFDEATAILAGDALYALSFEQLSHLGHQPGTSEVVASVATTARILCEGQSMDMAFETSWPELDAYETMIRRKTAALFACATANGARLAGADEATIEALATFGESLGLAFQIQDDVLDLTVETDALGKPQGSDVLAGKKTHPMILARQAASPREKERLEMILDRGAQDRDEVAWVVDLCEETGAITQSTGRAFELFEQARQALDALDPSPARDDLEGVLTWVRDRGH